MVICVYIDDTLCAGDINALKLFKKELRTFFSTKEEGKMDGYIGCQIRQINENCIVMHQSELINKMERIFREDINKLRSRDMPFGTNNRNARPKDEEVLISKEDQTKY